MAEGSERSEEGHFLFEYGPARFLELSHRRCLCLLWIIVKLPPKPKLNRRVHAAVEPGEDEQPAAQRPAQPAFGCYGVWQDHPDEGDCAAGGHGEELVGAEEVDWVVGLAVGGADFEAEFADLDLLLDGLDMDSGGCTWSSYPTMTLRVTMAMMEGPKTWGLVT